MLCLHVVYSTVHSREIMVSLIMAKYCRCSLSSFCLLQAASSWIGIVIPSSLVPVLNHGSRC